MGRNTSHLNPSKRLKIYSGRDGTASLNRPTSGEYATYKLGGDHGNTKVRSGAASQKEHGYVWDAMGNQAAGEDNYGNVQSKDPNVTAICQAEEAKPKPKPKKKAPKKKVEE